MKKVCIIGAGWYGLHIALFLQSKGIDFDIYEKEKNVFLGSSGYNQFRAHEGFHYPRSSKTIEEIKRNSLKFKNKYGKYLKFYKKNIYCIASNESIVDFGSYISLMKSQKLKYQVIKKPNFLNNIEGCINCFEGVIKNNKVKKFFLKKLKKKIIFNKEITKKSLVLKNYSKVLDFTNANLFKNFNKNPKNILTISLVYKEKNNHLKYPITVMDGNFPSLYPYSDNKNLWTLTHAKYTHIKKFNTFSSMTNFKKKFSKNKIKKLINKFEESIVNFYPSFKDNFKYKNFFWSYKSISESKSAERYIYYGINKNILSIYSPKIQNIFSAEEIVNKFLNV